MRLLELLITDHCVMKDQLDKLVEAVDGGRKEQAQDIFTKVSTSFEQHSQAEENLFYPLIHGQPDVGDLIQRARAQHESIQDLLNKMRPMFDNDIGRLAGTVSDLKHRITEHVLLEESEIFAKAEEILSPKDMRRLATQLRRAEPELHP